MMGLEAFPKTVSFDVGVAVPIPIFAEFSVMMELLMVWAPVNFAMSPAVPVPVIVFCAAADNIPNPIIAPNVTTGFAIKYGFKLIINKLLLILGGWIGLQDIVRNRALTKFYRFFLRQVKHESLRRS
jgi:hypothetical protein